MLRTLKDQIWCPLLPLPPLNPSLPSMHHLSQKTHCLELLSHPQRQNVTTSMVGLKTVIYTKNPTKNGEPQRYTCV